MVKDRRGPAPKKEGVKFEVLSATVYITLGRIIVSCTMMYHVVLYRRTDSAILSSMLRS